MDSPDTINDTYCRLRFCNLVNREHAMSSYVHPIKWPELRKPPTNPETLPSVRQAIIEAGLKCDNSQFGAGINKRD